MKFSIIVTSQESRNLVIQCIVKNRFINLNDGDIIAKPECMANLALRFSDYDKELLAQIFFDIDASFFI